MASRYIPVDVRRELRQEVNYGCAFCGIPLIQYHHIVPFSEEEHHDPDRMIALCPNCHAEADAGTIKRERLYDIKENPEIDDVVEHDFYFEPSNRMLVLGNVGVQLHDGIEGSTPVLRVDGEDLVKIRYEAGILGFDVDFYSESEIVASIENGEWWVDTAEIWDLEYKKKTLKIWSTNQNLGLAISYEPEKDQIFISGHLSYNGKLMTIRRESGIHFEEHGGSISSLSFSLPDGDGAAISW